MNNRTAQPGQSGTAPAREVDLVDQLPADVGVRSLFAARRQATGGPVTEYARSLGNLASLEDEHGSREESIKLYECVLEIKERTLGRQGAPRARADR